MCFVRKVPNMVGSLCVPSTHVSSLRELDGFLSILVLGGVGRKYEFEGPCAN